jgi:Nicastrin
MGQTSKSFSNTLMHGCDVLSTFITQAGELALLQMVNELRSCGAGANRRGSSRCWRRPTRCALHSWETTAHGGAVFLALAGEAWDYTGSRRLLWEMRQGSHATAGLDLDLVGQVCIVLSHVRGGCCRHCLLVSRQRSDHLLYSSTL